MIEFFTFLWFNLMIYSQFLLFVQQSFLETVTTVCFGHNMKIEIQALLLFIFYLVFLLSLYVYHNLSFIFWFVIFLSSTTVCGHNMKIARQFPSCGFCGLDSLRTRDPDASVTLQLSFFQAVPIPAVYPCRHCFVSPLSHKSPNCSEQLKLPFASSGWKV